MDHYTKTSTVAAESEEKKEPCEINVKSGSKIRNIVAQAYRMLQIKKGERIILTGSGPTVTKAITCAEIIKRKIRGLHQLNKLFYTKTEDTWEPKEDSLDKLQVTKRIPSISITLSKVPLDATQPGYQAPGKSKSPVQFGDEDWELAWEEDSPKVSKSKNNGQKDKRTKSKNKGNEDEETCAKSMKTLHEVSRGHSESHSTMDTDEGLPQDNTCGNDKGQSKRVALNNKQGGSQRTLTQGNKGTHRKSKNFTECKSKLSPQETQKSEES